MISKAFEDKILIVEDDREDYLAIKDALKVQSWISLPDDFNDYSDLLVSVERLEDLVKYLRKICQNQKPYAAIVDLSYVDKDIFGIKVIEELKSINPYMPIVVFTRYNDMQNKVAKYPATYFVPKPNSGRKGIVSKVDGIIVPWLNGFKIFSFVHNMSELSRNQDLLINIFKIQTSSILYKLDDLASSLENNSKKLALIFELSLIDLQASKKKQAKEYFLKNFPDSTNVKQFSEIIDNKITHRLKEMLDVALEKGSYDAFKEAVLIVANEFGCPKEIEDKFILSSLWLLLKGIMKARHAIGVI